MPHRGDHLGWRGRLALGLAALALSAAAPAALALGREQASESSVKAAYLAKFGAFVEWPQSAFAAPASPLVLCIVGDNPFGGALDQTKGYERLPARNMPNKVSEYPPTGPETASPPPAK